MKIYTEIAALEGAEGAIHLAIGVFDGVHVGHQKVIRRALQGASQDRGSGIVVTFDPHPAEVLRPSGGPLLITPGSQQRAVMAEMGVEAILEIKFDRAFAEVTAEEFVLELVTACRGRLKRICVGYDWRFGKGRKGDVGLLSRLGQREGFEVTAIPAVELEGVVVRSTRVREAVSNGDLETAEKLLGRRYGISGLVVEGEGIGRELGYPTANLRVENRLMPPFGVYAVWCEVGGQRVRGVANFGTRPSVAPDNLSGRWEVHLLDWSGDLYGSEIRAEFVSRLRGEHKFANLDELVDQIGRDIVEARRRLRE